MSKFKIISVEKRLQKKQRKKEYQLANRVTLDYCFYDPIRADKVFTPESEKIIAVELKTIFDGAIPQHAVNHEYGEILNHFGP